MRNQMHDALLIACIGITGMAGCATEEYAIAPTSTPIAIRGVLRRGPQRPQPLTPSFPSMDENDYEGRWHNLIETRGRNPTSRFPDSWVLTGTAGTITWYGEGDTFLLELSCPAHEYFAGKHTSGAGFTGICFNRRMPGIGGRMIIFVNERNADYVRSPMHGLYEFMVRN